MILIYILGLQIIMMQQRQALKKIYKSENYQCK